MVWLAVSAIAAVVALQVAEPLRVVATGARPQQAEKRVVEPRGDSPRADAIARAQVWTPTRVAAMDVKAGPKVTGGFPFHATIFCDYTAKDMSGMSPKFACLRGEADDLKVKYGGTNAEVYAEVAATRLLWALGFGADAMFPVRVICRGCPPDLAGISRAGDEWLFDPATIERKRGREFDDEGWHWRELETVDAGRGGAPRAHRDALKLLAVFLQHTDSKPQQQRLACLDAVPRGVDKDSAPCRQPFMMINDLGLTFGRANMFNANDKAMNLVEWAATPIWKPGKPCVGNLPRSMTGTLVDPEIGEEGRQFLAGLLTQLTDAQIRALFEVSRVTLRVREPGNARSGLSTVDEWVAAFKAKRVDIVDRRCP
jgi:hypothetical protein